MSAVDEAEADAQFAEWMRLNLNRAADHFGLQITGPPVYGWRLRSIGAPALGPAGSCWIRVVSEFPEWAQGDSWRGNADANALTNLAKPQVVDGTEWDEQGWRRQRAEVMTLLPGQPCSPNDVLREDIDLSDGWWADLRRSIDVLRRVPTGRINIDQEQVSRRSEVVFGEDLTIRRWETVHGDLHWNNLLRPQFGVLDWELWGRGPAGMDPATLLCYSLLVPNVAARVHHTFADILDTVDGRRAQLVVTARLLSRVDDGDHLDLAEPLRERARSLKEETKQ